MTGIAARSVLSVVARRQHLRMHEASLGPMPFAQSLEVTDDGLVFENRWGTVKYLWSSIAGVDESPHYVIVSLKAGEDVIVPKRAFAKGGDAEFAASVRKRLAPI